MATTDKRQLRLTISSILQSYSINDLAIEAKLTDAVSIFVDETKKGKDPVIVRKDILTGMLEYKSKYEKHEFMSDRIETALKLHPDGGDTWNAVVEHCIKKLEIGQTIEHYVKWTEVDIYNSPKAHQIAMNPKIIITTWPQAFAGVAQLTPTQTDAHGLPESY